MSKELERKKRMHPRVTVAMQRSIHLRDYENFNIDVGLSRDVAGDETIDDVLKITENVVYKEVKKLTKFVRKHVK